MTLRSLNSTPNSSTRWEASVSWINSVELEQTGDTLESTFPDLDPPDSTAVRAIVGDRIEYDSQLREGDYLAIGDQNVPLVGIAAGATVTDDDNLLIGIMYEVTISRRNRCDRMRDRLRAASPSHVWFWRPRPWQFVHLYIAQSGRVDFRECICGFVIELSDYTLE